MKHLLEGFLVQLSLLNINSCKTFKNINYRVSGQIKNIRCLSKNTVLLLLNICCLQSGNNNLCRLSISNYVSHLTSPLPNTSYLQFYLIFHTYHMRLLSVTLTSPKLSQVSSIRLHPETLLKAQISLN